MISRQPMNSRLQSQARSTTYSTSRSFELRRLKGIAIAALVASSVSFAGCQQMGFRSRNDELKQMIEEQDDWALPLSSNNRVPRPNVGEIMAKRRSDAAKRRAIEAGETADQAIAEQVKPSGNEPKTALNTNDSSTKDTSTDKSNSIPSTNNQEIDIEGALSSLPPGYRDILKKQLDAAQRQANTGLRQSRNVSDENQDATVASKSSAVEPNAESQIVLQKVPKEKSSSKVSVRLSDSNTDDAVMLASNVSKADAVDHQVTNALALSHTSSNKVEQNGSHVEKASSTSPAQVTQPSATIPSPSLPQAASPTTPLSAPPAYNNATAANPLSWRHLLGQTIEQLEKQIKEIPPADENLRISQEVTLRMLYLSQRRLNDATREIEVLSEQEQDYFRHQMHALYEASNPDAMPVRSRHWSLVMNSQREATNLLAAVSNLEVKSAAFCTQVEGYGVITKFPKYQFKPDEELLLYCEIENVAAAKVKDGYESQLQGSYEIIDSQGRKIADQLLPIESEICQNHRRDYFIVYKIFMPQQISPGNYQLRLTVEDTKARKFGQSNLDFQIKK